MKNQITAPSTRFRILVFSITMLFVACVGVVASVRAGLILSATQQTAPAEKTVEQTRKNIQVLSGLPDSQLFTVMNFVGDSLGVQCTYCHVKNGKDPKTGFDNWVWESDDKPEKQTARRMMRMVLTLNKSNGADFSGDAVTCYTCHRGHTVPVGAPPMPLTTSAHEPAGAVATASPGPMPTADQVLSKYVAAVGGEAAAAKLNARVMKGTVEASQGRSFQVEIAAKGADKYLVTIATPEGPVYQGLDGTTGWAKNSRGVFPLNPGQLAQIKTSAENSQVLKVNAPFTKYRLAGTEKIGDHDTYVTARTLDDGKIERLFFDQQTGLLLRRVLITTTLLAPIPEQLDFDDYREVDGAKLPFVIRLSNVDTFFSSTRRLTEMKPSILDDAIFKMPSPAASPSPSP